VPLVVIAPLVGIAIVPVTLPVGAGLTPSDVISVESIGIPAGPTDPPGLIPRGEVVPSEGIAVSGSSTSTWANAGPAHNKDQAVTAIRNGLMQGFPVRAIGFATISRGARLSDIGQSPVAAHEASRAYCIALEPRRHSRPTLLLCTQGGRLARPVQLNTRLLSWSTRPRRWVPELFARPGLEAKNKFN
jgi:hypothetical protein